MMKYDFITVMNRSGKDSIAADLNSFRSAFVEAEIKEGFDIIPMWVADMNFPTVPTITKRIIDRATHPAFGYFAATDEYFDSIIYWHKTRNGVTDLKKEYCSLRTVAARI